MKNILLLLLLSFTIGTFIACDDELAQPRSDWGYNYFPLAIGMEWNYEMDSITLRPQVGGVLFDSVHLMVRETLADTIRDLENKLWYRGERYDRHADTLPWRFRQTFLLRTDGQRAYRQEDNLEFVKMVFPTKTFKNWDGNVAFDQYREIDVAGQPIAIYRDWNYFYTSVDEPETVYDIQYDSLTVIEGVDSDDDIVDRRYAIEKYARGVGLVYREMEIFETQCNDCCSLDLELCISLPWREKAESGFIIRQWLVE